MRYRIPLLGNPGTDVALRNKYIAAFGSACYMSVSDTFDCFYKKWQDACADAVKIGEVWGGPNAAYVKGKECMPVGNGDYTLQVGSDMAVKITINYQAAPLQTSLTEIDGVPTAVNGPYRNLPEPQQLKPGEDFYCASVDDNGKSVQQRERILQMNRDKNGGEIHSDLPGYTYPCVVNGNATTCIEPVVLKEKPPNDPDAAQVHHVVPRFDERRCPWGTNSNKNAAVISRRLNRFLWYKNPPAEEVAKINDIPPYMP